MYYEEILVGGVLAFRTSPDTEFVLMSGVQLTNRILELTDLLNAARANQGGAV